MVYQPLFTREELQAWKASCEAGNGAARFNLYWTTETTNQLARSVQFKIPITVDEIREALGIYSPLSRIPEQPWTHPDEETGLAYLYQILEPPA